jgi:hypothetical protein
VGAGRRVVAPHPGRVFAPAGVGGGGGGGGWEERTVRSRLELFLKYLIS